MLDRFTTITGAVMALGLLLAVCGCLHYKRAADDAEALRATAEARLRLCEQSVDALAKEAQERAAEAAKALEQAKVRARTLEQRADRMLRQPAAVPGDDCASAKARARAWLEGRGQ